MESSFNILNRDRVDERLVKFDTMQEAKDPVDAFRSVLAGDVLAEYALHMQNISRHWEDVWINSISNKTLSQKAMFNFLVVCLERDWNNNDPDFVRSYELFVKDSVFMDLLPQDALIDDELQLEFFVLSLAMKTQALSRLLKEPVPDVERISKLKKIYIDDTIAFLDNQVGQNDSEEELRSGMMESLRAREQQLTLLLTRAKRLPSSDHGSYEKRRATEYLPALNTFCAKYPPSKVAKASRSFMASIQKISKRTPLLLTIAEDILREKYVPSAEHFLVKEAMGTATESDSESEGDDSDCINIEDDVKCILELGANKNLLIEDNFFSTQDSPDNAADTNTSVAGNASPRKEDADELESSASNVGEVVPQTPQHTASEVVSEANASEDDTRDDESLEDAHVPDTPSPAKPASKKALANRKRSLSNHQPSAELMGWSDSDSAPAAKKRKAKVIAVTKEKSKASSPKKKNPKKADTVVNAEVPSESMEDSADTPAVPATQASPDDDISATQETSQVAETQEEGSSKDSEADGASAAAQTQANDDAMSDDISDPESETPAKNPSTGSKTRRLKPLEGGVNLSLRRKWDQDETDALIEGVNRFGIGRWKRIYDEYNFHCRGRTQVNLKDKWRNLQKYHS